MADRGSERRRRHAGFRAGDEFYQTTESPSRTETFRVFYASCEEEGRCLSPSESLTGLVDQLITPANSSHSNFQNVCGHQSWSAKQRSLLKTIERRMELNWLVDCLQNLNPVRYSYTTAAYSFSAFPKGNIQSYIYITPA